MAAEPTGRKKRATGRAWTRPDRDSVGALGIAHIGLILGVVALVLGGAGLGIAITNSGHVGPAGPMGVKGDTGGHGTNGTDGKNGSNGTNGSRGPSGPGAQVVQTFDISTTFLNTTCVAYAYSNLTVTVTGAGTFVVTAAVVLDLYHSSGGSTSYLVSLANASAVCNPVDNSYSEGAINGALPTSYYSEDVSLVQSFSIGAAGTYNVDIIGTADMTAFGDTTAVYYASEVGVFYPA
jgi:hypothetical protein